jgi:ubiquinone/menaquinone biosynthesis C-methylase UbiE
VEWILAIGPYDFRYGLHDMKIRDETKEHQRHIADMVDYYARTAPAYNRWHSDLQVKGPHNYAVSCLMSLVRRQNYRSVLDVCCGTGRAVKMCLENGIDAHGVDISQELINEGIRAWNLPADRFTRADATQLPFPDKHFDVSCVLGGLHHSAVPGRIVEEMIRVTRHAIIISDEGNHLHGGIKTILQRLRIFPLVYRIIFRRAPRTVRRATFSAEDGPAYTFSTNEIVPLVKANFQNVQRYQFYRCLKFHVVSSRLPLLFARNVVLIADSRNSEGHLLANPNSL